MAIGTVKFFNSAKGFGFISPDEGGADVFVHISAVERSGLGGLNDGDQVSFELEQDRRSGKMAATDLQLLGSGGGASSAGARRPPQRSSFDRPARSFDRDTSYGATMGSGEGVVKWFNPVKGFGFIQPASGGGDVFVHISAVEQAGLSGLNEGQRVAFELTQDRRTGKTSATKLQIVD